MDTARPFEVVAVDSFVSPDELQIHRRYPLLHVERLAEFGIQVMILANRTMELHDKQLCLITPITKLNQVFTELLNNKVLYFDVAYKGMNRHNRHILEFVRVNLPLAMRIAVPEFSKCLQEIRSKCIWSTMYQCINQMYNNVCIGD